VALEERLEAAEITTFGIEQWFLVLTSWIYVESREALDANSGNVVLGSVELGNYDLLVSIILSCQLLPDRGKLFAMTAPRGIVLNKDSQVGIIDNGVVVSSNQSADTLAGIFMGFFALGKGLGSTFVCLFNKLNGTFQTDFFRKFVFLLVVVEINEEELRGFCDIKKTLQFFAIEDERR